MASLKIVADKDDSKFQEPTCEISIVRGGKISIQYYDSMTHQIAQSRVSDIDRLVIPEPNLISLLLEVVGRDDKKKCCQEIEMALNRRHGWKKSLTPSMFLSRISPRFREICKPKILSLKEIFWHLIEELEEARADVLRRRRDSHVRSFCETRTAGPDEEHFCTRNNCDFGGLIYEGQDYTRRVRISKSGAFVIKRHAEDCETVYRDYNEDPDSQNKSRPLLRAA